MSQVAFYGKIARVTENSDGSVYVEGCASTEQRDEQPSSIARYGKGQIIKADAMRGAIPGYMQWGAVREMHQPIAAGKAVSCEVRDDNQTYLRALIVDEGSIKKVKSGVLSAFSVNGSVTKRNAEDPSIIEALSLVEISLVDVPGDAGVDKFTVCRIAEQEEAPMEADKAASETPAQVILEPAKAETVAAPAAPEPAPAPHGFTAAPTLGGAITRSDGRELWDARTALEAALQIASLLSWELAEAEPEGEQTAMLASALEALKKFVAAEVLEEIAPDAIGNAAEGGDIQRGDYPGHPFRGNQHAGGSGEGGSHNKASSKAHAASKNAGKGASKEAHEKASLAHGKAAKAHEKAGNEDTAAYHQKMADYHARQANKSSGDKAKRAAETTAPDTIKRVAELEDIVSRAGEALKKVVVERDDQIKRVSELTQELDAAKVEVARKGSTRAVPVDKSQDGQIQRAGDNEPEPTDTVGLIMRAHKTPVPIYR